MPTAARSRSPSGIDAVRGISSGRRRATIATVITYSTARITPGMNAAAKSFGSDCSATIE